MRRLVAHYQPIVDLSSGGVVGYEALAREDGAFPGARFAAARATGGLSELDTECIRAAFAGAEGLQSSLFVNVEPAVFDGPPAFDGPPRVIIEITERELTTRPAELLLAVERVRSRGWGIAVDDLGAEWRSLALLPLLLPDVIKLDRAVIQQADEEARRTVSGAQAHIARHGGLLLAEGIEDAGHERRATTLGARYGQGWHYGRPGLLAGADRAVSAPPLVLPRRPIGPETPLQLLRGAALGTGTKRELLPLSIGLEREAAAMRDPSVVLATFQHDLHFTPRSRERYSRLASGAAFVAAFGVGLDPEPAPGVRGANLAAGEALESEWTVVVVGPHSARALIARDLGDSGPDMDRRFEYVLTEDRELVTRAARSLMLRVAAEPAGRPAIRADLGVSAPRVAGVGTRVPSA